MSRARIRVLLVDDDEDDFLITSGVIEDIGGGYDVTWRDSYAGALEILAQQAFDVLVFDYRIGAETGIDLLREVRARNYPAPIILLTGQQDSDIDDEAIRLGAADYLIKGKINADSFERSVRHAIHQHEILAQLHESNAFLQSILDALTSEVAILDAHGAFLAVNRTWRQSFSAQAQESARLDFFTWRLKVPEEELAAAQQLVAGVRKVTSGDLESFSMECPITANGANRWVIARVSSFGTATRTFVVVAYEDITVRKRAELEVEHSRARMEELSLRDELTSLYNRRFFNGALDREINLATRNGTEFAVLMLDVDRFKSVNDTYGHQAGDDALRHVAQICRNACRACDCVARFGGEEIAFVLPESSREGALRFAERVRAGLESAPLELRSDAGDTFVLNLTASLGIACYPSDAKTAPELVSIADKGLYAAKSTGRNRVCCAAA